MTYEHAYLLFLLERKKWKNSPYPRGHLTGTRKPAGRRVVSMEYLLCRKPWKWIDPFAVEIV